jgi:hypothetical protein
VNAGKKPATPAKIKAIPNNIATNLSIYVTSLCNAYKIIMKPARLPVLVACDRAL